VFLVNEASSSHTNNPLMSD